MFTQLPIDRPGLVGIVLIIRFLFARAYCTAEEEKTWTYDEEYKCKVTKLGISIAYSTFVCFLCCASERD